MRDGTIVHLILWNQLEGFMIRREGRANVRVQRRIRFPETFGLLESLQGQSTQLVIAFPPTRPVPFVTHVETTTIPPFSLIQVADGLYGHIGSTQTKCTDGSFVTFADLLGKLKCLCMEGDTIRLLELAPDLAKSLQRIRERENGTPVYFGQFRKHGLEIPPRDR